MFVGFIYDLGKVEFGLISGELVVAGGILKLFDQFHAVENVLDCQFDGQ